MYIGIAGNIGSGKSAMAQLLMEEFECSKIDSNGDSNPYLANFYGDMSRWALNLQVYFLTHRFRAVQRAMWSEQLVVQDRTIYEDAYVFVDNLFHMGILSGQDHRTYRDLFETMVAFVRPPELLIYLKASVPSLLHNIRQRGVTYESGISVEYLGLLNQRYEQWVADYGNNILTIEVDGTDFVRNAEARARVIDCICSQLPQLEKFRKKR